MKDGTKFSFKWEMKDGAVANLKAYDKDGNELFLNDLYQGQQKYVVWMPEGSADDVDLSVDTTKGSVMVKADIDNGEAEYYFTNQVTGGDAQAGDFFLPDVLSECRSRTAVRSLKYSRMVSGAAVARSTTGLSLF